jgi:hypothetical protein
MNRLSIKLEYFFYFLRSKILKKKIFNSEEIGSLNFKKKSPNINLKIFGF